MEGVTDSANFNLLDELARLVAAKLSLGHPGTLASKQWVARSSRARDAIASLQSCAISSSVFMRMPAVLKWANRAFQSSLHLC